MVPVVVVNFVVVVLLENGLTVDPMEEVNSFSELAVVCGEVASVNPLSGISLIEIFRILAISRISSLFKKSPTASCIWDSSSVLSVLAEMRPGFSDTGLLKLGSLVDESLDEQRVKQTRGWKERQGLPPGWKTKDGKRFNLLSPSGKRFFGTRKALQHMVNLSIKL